MAVGFFIFEFLSAIADFLLFVLRIYFSTLMMDLFFQCVFQNWRKGRRSGYKRSEYCRKGWFFSTTFQCAFDQSEIQNLNRSELVALNESHMYHLFYGFFKKTFR